MVDCSAPFRMLPTWVPVSFKVSVGPAAHPHRCTGQQGFGCSEPLSSQPVLILSVLRLEACQGWWSAVEPPSFPPKPLGSCWKMGCWGPRGLCMNSVLKPPRESSESLFRRGWNAWLFKKLWRIMGSSMPWAPNTKCGACWVYWAGDLCPGRQVSNRCHFKPLMNALMKCQRIYTGVSTCVVCVYICAPYLILHLYNSHTAWWEAQAHSLSFLSLSLNSHFLVISPQTSDLNSLSFSVFIYWKRWSYLLHCCMMISWDLVSGLNRPLWEVANT